MPDIIQVAEQLKDAPDQWLAQQMQNPSGVAPPWLVASEVARRDRLRSGASKAQAPQSSVSQDLIRSLYARVPPTAGLMPQGGPPTPPGMPPVNLTPGSNPSTLGAAPGGTPPGNFKMPTRMAAGGMVDDDPNDDSTSDDGYDPYNIPLQNPSRRAQLDQLMIPPAQMPQQAPATAPQAPVMTAAAAPAPAPTARPNGYSVAGTDPEIKLSLNYLINQAAQRYQVPPELIKAVMGRESHGDPNAVSPKGAIGLMQVMPKTATDYGVTDPSELLDPARNIDVGTRHLKKMLTLFNGDVPTALAAYNEGQGSVMKQLRAGKPYFNETQNYVKNLTKDLNAQRKQLGLPADANPQLSSLSSRLLGPQDSQQETAQPPAPPAPPTMPPVATPSMAGPVPPAVDNVAPGAPATKTTVPKKEPLHQSWMPPANSPEAEAIQRQINEKMAGHQSVEDRQRALLQPSNLDLLNAAGKSIFGAPQDYTQYATAINQVMAMAQQQMHPGIGQGLIDWGLAMMANKSHNFGVAMGQAGAYAMDKYQTSRQQGIADYLTAAKAGVELQEKQDQYNARIGQYKMQRLASQQAGVTADERAFQSDINSLARQKNTAQINYEKALTTPSAVNTMAMAIMNREGIQFNPQGPEPIKQLEAVGNPTWLNEAYLAGKPGGAGKAMNSVERTQETRAISLLNLVKDDWEPETNPDDAQYASARAKLEAKHKDLASLITTAQGANWPKDMKIAEDYADAVFAGREDPTMTGMYGKQALIKAILENKYHYDVARAVLEWNATKTFYQNANNAQFIEYSTNVQNVANQIPYVLNAYAAWKRALTAEVPDVLTRFQGFNRAALNWSMSTGGEMGALARRLNTHILDLQSSLPKVYSGGYAPHTDAEIRAQEMIGANWDEPSFMTGMGVIGDTMLARKNAVQMVVPRFAGTTYTRGLPGNQQNQPNQPNQQNQPEKLQALPAMMSPLDKDKTFLAPNGRKVKILEVDPNNWHRYRYIEVP